MFMFTWCGSLAKLYRIKSVQLFDLNDDPAIVEMSAFLHVGDFLRIFISLIKCESEAIFKQTISIFVCENIRELNNFKLNKTYAWDSGP